MSASERDHQGGFTLAEMLAACAEERHLCDAKVRTAHVEGQTAGYARGRREAFSEGAELLARLCYCCADDDNDTEARDCMACQCAAALREKAEEEKP